VVDTVCTREQWRKLFPSCKQASCNYYEKTKNRIETTILKKPKPKTELTGKKTDHETENRNLPKNQNHPNPNPNPNPKPKLYLNLNASPCPNLTLIECPMQLKN